MDPSKLATELVNRRLATLRELGRQQLAARHKPAEPVVNVATPEHPAPVVNVTVVVPPEAIKILLEQRPAQVTVNVPEQKPPVVNVQAPEVRVAAPVVHVQAPEIKFEPKIEVQVPAAEKPKSRTATIRHPDGSNSSVEIK